MSNTLLMPPQIIYGENALAESMEYVEKSGTKALIVTDEVMVEIGNIAQLEGELKKIGVDYVIYDGVGGEPTDEMVEKGIELYQDNDCDFLIAMGGGSPIDTMKAIGVMVTNEGQISDYMGKTIPNPPPALVAIPTTAGTGSEATAVTVITDTENDVKMMLLDPVLVPTTAIVDPSFTLTKPRSVTVATGVDALTHAIEAFTSKKAQPLTDVFAVSAIKRIYNNLLIVYEDGKNIDSRTEMILGSLEAGVAFHNSSVTIVHGMSRPIGALYGVPHGLSNAVLLKDCLAFIKEGATDRFAILARELEFVDTTTDDETAANIFYDKILELLSKVNIQTLEEFGIDKEDFYSNVDKMAVDALASGSPANTRKTPTKEDIMEIYKKLWE